MIIQHNMVAMYASNRRSINSMNKSKSAEKLSTGYRINRAADDAAGLAISEKMRAQIRGLDQGSKNIQDGISLCQVADGAANEIHDILQRMNELSVSAANGTKTEDDRQMIQKEMNQLNSEINRICVNTEFNGIEMFSATNIPYPEGQPEDIKIFNIDANTYGGIVFNDRRYTWNDINSNLLNEDGTFLPGKYPFTTDDGVLINFIAKNGSKPPELLREYSITADNSGITIDNQQYTWGSMGLDINKVEPGTYQFHYAGSNISFDVTEGMDASLLIDSINQDNLKAYDWNSVYDYTSYSKAVDITQVGAITITNANKDYISSDTPPYTLKADNDGVWMEATNGGAVNTVCSKMSWADLGIANWSSGQTIDTTKTYTYTDSYTGLSIGFQIPHEEAGIQEVISGLDGAVINAKMNIFTGEDDFSASNSSFKFADLRDMGCDFDNISDTVSWLSPLGEVEALGNTHSLDVIEGATLTHYECGDNLSLTYPGSPSNIVLTANNVYVNLVQGLSDYMQSNSTGIYNYTCTLSSSNGSTIDYTIGCDVSEIASGETVEDYATKRLSNFKDNYASFKIAANKPYFSNYSATEDPLGNEVRITNYAHSIVPIPRILNVQASGQGSDSISIELTAMNSVIMGLGKVDVSTEEKAGNLIRHVADAINYVSDIRNSYGSRQNRLEYAMNVNNITSENTSMSESIKRDTDMASEMVQFSKYSILEQVSDSILAQANKSTQSILSLLQQ